MLLPLSWLKEYVDVENIPVEQLVSKLFSCGFEVEEIVRPWAQVSGCVVGKIKEIYPHPNADTLSICKVDCGKSGGDLQIVTGAKNVKTGDCVPVAVDGATLFDGKVINTGELRGQVSQGMLCSGEELGIDDDWYDGAGVDGILILCPSDEPGADIKQLLGLNDCILDISLTANRPDCACVLGMAREVAAAFSLPQPQPKLDYQTVQEDSGLNVSVLAPDLCPRYIGCYVKDVIIAPSPLIIRRRLKLCGINAISNVVDVTNYILLELGQPMHAFDVATIEKNEIIVRRAQDGEKITTLDEREFALSTDNLLICDGAKPVGIAGIMGGLNSEIRDTTTGVVFEAAKFERSNIRRSSRALGQFSDSSRRFEKGVDEYTTEVAMRRALHLMDKYGFGVVTSTYKDIWATPDKKNEPVVTTIPKINSVLGIDVPADIIGDILRRLDFEVQMDGQTIAATAPPYRADVEDFPDLAEEVIRIYGFGHIKPTVMQSAAITPGGYTREQKLRRKLRDAVMAGGFYEGIHFSFYSPRDLDMLGLPSGAPERDAVVVSNPITEHYSIMRRTLAASMLHTISRNCKRGVSEGRLFELANSYIPVAGQPLPEEIPLLCLGLFGAEESYLTAKGALEQIADALGQKLTFQKDARPHLHPGITAKVLLGGEEIGYVGQISYQAQQAFEIPRPVFIAELDTRALLAACGDDVKFRPLPAFLEVHRDLALVADESVPSGEIEAVITTACPQVGKVRLFDVYRSEQIGSGKKSMAYALTFTPGERALSGEEVDGFVQQILSALADSHGIALR